MPLLTPAVWGKDTADAIKALIPAPGTPIDDSVLEAMWTAVKTVTVGSLGAGAVAPGTFLDSLAAPITGIGGPVT